MRLFTQIPIGPKTGLGEIDVLPEHTVGEVKEQVCASFHIAPQTVNLMYGGQVLDDVSTISSVGITENAQLALMPYNITGAVAYR